MINMAQALLKISIFVSIYYLAVKPNDPAEVVPLRYLNNFTGYPSANFINSSIRVCERVSNYCRLAPPNLRHKTQLATGPLSFSR